MVDYTVPDVIHEMADIYTKHGTPFVMGTTGGDRAKLAADVRKADLYAVIAPQMGKQVHSPDHQPQVRGLTYSSSSRHVDKLIPTNGPDDFTVLPSSALSKVHAVQAQKRPCVVQQPCGTTIYAGPHVPPQHTITCIWEVQPEHAGVACPLAPQQAAVGWVGSSLSWASHTGRFLTGDLLEEVHNSIDLQQVASLLV